MEKINLDAIATNEAKNFATGSLRDSTAMSLFLRNVMTEAIDQALSIAANNAQLKYPLRDNEVDKDSILAVKLLIV